MLSLGLGAGMLAISVAMDLERSDRELGHQLHPDPVRTTEFAPALPPPSPHTAPASGYAPWRAGLVLESRSNQRPGLCSPARWDATLPGFPEADRA